MALKWPFMCWNYRIS